MGPTFGELDPAVLVDADVGPDDVGAQAHVQLGHGPLALVVAHHLVAGRAEVGRAGGGGRRHGCKGKEKKKQIRKGDKMEQEYNG